MSGSPIKRHHARRAHLGLPFAVANGLEALVWLYGDTDKGAHGYLPYYRRHLGPRRWSKLLVFEIGVGGYSSRIGGGSLPVWRDYLPRSRVVGIDIHPKDIKWGSRVFFEQADQSDQSQLQAVVDKHGRPDVVIDDGSHVGEHVASSFYSLWTQLAPKGLYVIEDAATSYAPAFGGANPPPARSAVGVTQQLADDVQAGDAGFLMYPEFAAAPEPHHEDVAAVHVYPGIVFVEKAG